MSPATAPPVCDAGGEARLGRGAAAGKLILLGEHAVVYGHPALAVGLPRGATARAQHAERSGLTLGEQPLVAAGDAAASGAGLAYFRLLEVLGVSCIEANAALQIPAGVGLGASAALGVALARAVVDLVGGPLDAGAVGRAAAAWEMVFHGRASGVDAAAAERGGCLLFSRARGAAPVVLPRALNVVVARVERAPSTRAMVEAVRLRREADPAGVDSLFREIEGLVHRATASLATGRPGELGPLLTHNQRLLGELGVSTPALDAACSVALDAGALGAKLTGAGGGGCLLALTDPDQASGVCARLSAEGFESFVARVEPRPAGA